MPQKVFKASNAAIANKVRNNASVSFRERIPVITQANLAHTYALMQEDPILWNEFFNVLIQRIGLTLFRDNSFENKMKPLKTGAMAYGGVVQELGANLLEAHPYDPDDTNVFNADKPDVEAYYHHVNRRDKYEMKLNEDMLEEAFLTEGQLAAFMNSLLALPQKSDEWDEYLIMRDILANVYANDGLPTYNIPNILTAPDKEAAGKQVATLLRTMYLKLKGFYNTAFNNAGMQTTSDDLVLLTTPEFLGTFDVEVLAAAYNMSKADFMADRVITIDEFNIPGTDAAFVDRDFFVVTDTKIKSTNIYNPSTLEWVYYYHHWGIYSASRMRNVLLFSHQDATNIVGYTRPTVTAVSTALATPVANNAVLEDGAEIKLTPTVTYSDQTTDANAYMVLTAETSAEASGEDGLSVVLPDAHTYIDRENVLHVSDMSLYDTLTVTTIATEDNTKLSNLVLNKVGYEPGAGDDTE